MLKLCQFGVFAIIIATSTDLFDGRWSRAGDTSRYAAQRSPGGRRGRPRKFNRPSSAVTLTLPDDVVAALRSIDDDLSRAVVRAAEPFIAKSPSRPAELSTFGDTSVIVVPPNRTLKERAGVEFIPLADGRALIAFDEGLSVPEIELRLRDALADPAFAAEDYEVFAALAQILTSSRQAEGTSLRRRSIIVLRGAKPPESVDGRDPDTSRL